MAEDDATVVIHMEKPFNALLYTLAVVGIVPEHAYGEGYGANPVGSGRYMLEQWDKGQQVILKANPDYYGEAPKIERVVAVFMEEDASLAAAQSGQVDVAYTSATFAAQQPAGYDLLNCASVDSRGISLPTISAGAKKTDEKGEAAAGNDVTCDLAVRQAINYGLDRQTYGRTTCSTAYGTRGLAAGPTACPGPPPTWPAPLDAGARRRSCSTDAELGAGRRRHPPQKDGAAPARDGPADHRRWRHRAPGPLGRGVANQMKAPGHRGRHQGRELGRPLPPPVHRPRSCGAGAPTPPPRLYEPDLRHRLRATTPATTAPRSTPTWTRPWPSPTGRRLATTCWQKAQWDGTTRASRPRAAAPWAWIANVDHLYFAREESSDSVAAQKPHPHGHGWSLVNNVDQWSLGRNVPSA